MLAVMEFIAILSGAVAAFAVSRMRDKQKEIKRREKPKAAYVAPDFSENRGMVKILR